ncbi:MAG: hypothetical protein ACLGIF_09550 [Actinomycetes bacterium]
MNQQPDDDQTDAADDPGGQVSEGPSSFGNAETSVGGADAVPDTPDIMAGPAEG